MRRSTVGSLGFGHGVHACVGRVLALLEAEALLGALVQQRGEVRIRGQARTVDDHDRSWADQAARQDDVRARA